MISSLSFRPSSIHLLEQNKIYHYIHVKKGVELTFQGGSVSANHAISNYFAELPSWTPASRSSYTHGLRDFVRTEKDCQPPDQKGRVGGNFYFVYLDQLSPPKRKVFNGNEYFVIAMIVVGTLA